MRFSIKSPLISTFIRISPEKFMKLNQVKKPFNVFIRLSQKKFVKILDEEQDQDFSVIEKYVKKGVDYLFLEFDKYELFVGAAMDYLLDNIQHGEGSEKEKTELLLDSIESIQNCVKNLGVNERTIVLIEKVVDSTEAMIEKTKGLDDLLSLLLVIDPERQQVLWSSQLELGGVVLVVFDDNMLSLWQVGLFSSHDLNELLQVLDFFWHFSQDK